MKKINRKLLNIYHLQQQQPHSRSSFSPTPSSSYYEVNQHKSGLHSLHDLQNYLTIY